MLEDEVGVLTVELAALNIAEETNDRREAIEAVEDMMGDQRRADSELRLFVSRVRAALPNPVETDDPDEVLEAVQQTGIRMRMMELHSNTLTEVMAANERSMTSAGMSGPIGPVAFEDGSLTSLASSTSSLY